MVTILKKNVKSITLKITPQREIFLTVPLNIPEQHIQRFLKKKQPWIKKQLQNIKPKIENNAPNKEYVSGESCLYLGRNYRIKVIENKQEYVQFFNDYIYIYTQDKTNTQRKKHQLETWLREQAKIIFMEILNKLNSTLNFTYNKIYIRKMKTHWGSCSKARNITLNIKLITKPKYCIEYVILHELIHLQHFNHSEDFYTMLTVKMPDWQWRKDVLEESIWD